MVSVSFSLDHKIALDFLIGFNRIKSDYIIQLLSDLQLWILLITTKYIKNMTLNVEIEPFLIDFVPKWMN